MRLRRRSSEDDGSSQLEQAEAAGEEAGETPASDRTDRTAPHGVRSSGPYDIDEVDGFADGLERIDLGSLLVLPIEGSELRLQVDEQSGQVQAAVLAGADGGVEVRAFAAPRGGDLWSEVRPRIAAEMAQHGGTATEHDGAFGVELHCRMPVPEDASGAVQPTRIVGINGPRWLLRATFLGRPAIDPASGAIWEQAVRAMVVRRGHGAMPVGDALPLTIPAQAQRAGTP